MNRQAPQTPVVIGKVVTYRCGKCEAEDTDRAVYTAPPLVLTCWNCGAGRERTIPEMLATGVGMFPVRE